MGIEEIVKRFETLPPARADRWNVETLAPGRLHLTRAVDGQFAIFLEGAKESFGPLPTNLIAQHSDDVTALPENRRFAALRIICGDRPHASRVLAHIAYELAWRLQSDPPPGNQSLISDIAWLLSLLGNPIEPMTPERQRGLVGECLFLRTLLLRCHETKSEVIHALNAWEGFDNAKRDFYRKGVAVEAKATSNASRLHYISSLDQLAPQEATERVFLFSVGIRQDPTAPRKLTDYISDVELLLVDKQGRPEPIALRRFREGLISYGFDWGHREVYESQSGFLAPHLAPAIFRETRLRRLTVNDFVDNRIPETVRSISYLLEVIGDPLSEVEVDGVLDSLLPAPPFS